MYLLICSCRHPKNLFKTRHRSWSFSKEIRWGIQVSFNIVFALDCPSYHDFFCVCFFSDCRRGARPTKHQDSATGLIRSILLALDELRLTEKTENGGRRVTKIGQQALDLIATQIVHDGL
jgi:hypothetical protein